MTDMKAGHKAKRALLFALHQLLCPYGLVVVSAFLTIDGASLVHSWDPAITTKTASWILTETPYFPVQITIALLSGLAIHKFSQFPFGQWMWVLPLVLLICTIIFAQIPLGESRIDYLFGWGGLPQNRHPPSYEVAITMPFYVSVVYSLGTLLGGFFPATHAQTTEVPV
jgi:hypothetical protein